MLFKFKLILFLCFVSVVAHSQKGDAIDKRNTEQNILKETEQEPVKRPSAEDTRKLHRNFIYLQKDIYKSLSSESGNEKLLSCCDDYVSGHYADNGFKDIKDFLTKSQDDIYSFCKNDFTFARSFYSGLSNIYKNCLKDSHGGSKNDSKPINNKL
jgi:hypothetical protein